jgi:hypothetical protein
MNNIHILPTDKPSRLYQTRTNPLILDSKFENGKTNRHIYITSDEEIKEGDWCINIGRLNETIIFPDKIIGKADYTADVLMGSNWRKIILTTDDQLIADGVQAIDDSFLEWFVKNPSCEFIEVEKTFVTNSGLGYLEYAILDSDFKVLEVVVNIPQSSYKIGEVTKLDGYEYITEYKIIIPQEEPKKESIEKYDLKECFENQIEQIKDKYGYMQKHFTPLMTHISKERVQMLFCGLELILKSDGTYFITDTTGG